MRRVVSTVVGGRTPPPPPPRWGKQRELLGAALAIKGCSAAQRGGAARCRDSGRRWAKACLQGAVVAALPADGAAGSAVGDSHLELMAPRRQGQGEGPVVTVAPSHDCRGGAGGGAGYGGWEGWACERGGRRQSMHAPWLLLGSSEAAAAAEAVLPPPSRRAAPGMGWPPFPSLPPLRLPALPAVTAAASTHLAPPRSPSSPARARCPPA